MNTTNIVRVLPGHTIDRKFLNEVLVKFPTVFGFAAQYEGQLVTENHSSAWKAEEIEELLKGTDSGHRVLMFGNWPNYSDVSDVQPFTLRGEADEPFLAFFYEGDFAKYAGMEDKHTDEFCFSNEVLFPRVEKAFRDAGEDTEKFLEQLRGDAVQRTLKNGYGHRGHFVFLPTAGDPIEFGENQIGAEYSWGSCSNAHGLTYTEKAPEPEKAAEPAKLSIMDRIRGKKAEAPPAAPDEVKPVKDPAPHVPPKKEDIKAPETETKTNLVEVQVPPKLTGGAKNFWLRTFNGRTPGDLPANHQSNKVTVWVEPALVEFAKRDVSNTKEMRRLVEEMKSAAGGKKVVDFKQDKPVSSKDNGGKSTVREPSANYVNTSTVLSKEDKEKSMTLMSGFLDKRLSPLEIQKLEAKWPQFSDEIGCQFNELLFITSDQIMKLFDGNKIATAAYIQMRRKYIEGSGVKLEDLVTGTKGEEPKAVNTEAVNDKSSEKPVVAAAKTGSKLSFLNRSAA